MSDRYKNEPLNTPEQKAYEKALNRIRELETKLTEKEALLKEALTYVEAYYCYDDMDTEAIERFLAKLKAGGNNG